MRKIHKKVGYVARSRDFEWMDRPDIKADLDKYGFQIISLLEDE